MVNDLGLSPLEVGSYFSLNAMLLSRKLYFLNIGRSLTLNLLTIPYIKTDCYNANTYI